MDYEGYTFVFFIKIYTRFFSFKCDTYYSLTFQRLKVLFKTQVTFICLN